MKSGYKILWTDHAFFELEKTIQYLEDNFSSKEIENLSQKIESIVSLISQNPQLFPKSYKKDIYRVSILKLNTMYYRVNGETVQIISSFSNRQSPKKRKI